MPDRCWNQKGHGILQLKDAIPYSCNLYFASLYNRISIKNFSEFYNIILPVYRDTALHCREFPVTGNGHSCSQDLISD